MASTFSIVNPHQQVRKANALVEARYNLTEAEQKLILIAASMISRNDSCFTRCQIRVSDMMRALGIEGHGKYGQLRHLARGLLGKKLFIRKDNSELEVTWVASCEYFTKQGLMELEFSQKLAPYLLQLKEQYTGYALENILRLQGKYALRLYELLCQYKTLGSRRIEVEALKHILEIPPEGAYEDFGRLRNRILEPSRQQINSQTDITFSYQPVKIGRPIVYIDFHIQIKGTSQRALPTSGGYSAGGYSARKTALSGPISKTDTGAEKEEWENKSGFLRYQRELVGERMKRMSESERELLQKDFIGELRNSDPANFKRLQEHGQGDLCIKAAFELFQIERLLSEEERDIQQWANQGHGEKAVAA